MSRRRTPQPPRGLRLVAAAALVAVSAAAGVLVGSAATARAAGPGIDLVEGSTTTARLAVPYPGHATELDITAHPATTGPSALSLVVTGGTGPLADGPDALVLTLADSAGAVLAQGTAADLAGRPVDLGTLEGEPVTVHGVAALPATAGDELQGVGLSLTFGLTATQDVSTAPTPGWGALAVTGAPALAGVALAGALVALGLLLLAARRRRRAGDAPA